MAMKQLETVQKSNQIAGFILTWNQFSLSGGWTVCLLEAGGSQQDRVRYCLRLGLQLMISPIIAFHD